MPITVTWLCCAFVKGKISANVVIGFWEVMVEIRKLILEIAMLLIVLLIELAICRRKL